MNSFGELHKEGQSYILKEAARCRYPAEDIEDRIWMSLDRVLHAQTLSEAHELLRKAKDKFDIHCLAAWSKGRIKGPASPEALEREAKQAESLANLLRVKVGDEAAEKQLKRAAKIRKEASKLVPKPAATTEIKSG
jgi:hypothetical protein